MYNLNVGVHFTKKSNCFFKTHHHFEYCNLLIISNKSFSSPALRALSAAASPIGLGGMFGIAGALCTVDGGSTSPTPRPAGVSGGSTLYTVHTHSGVPRRSALILCRSRYNSRRSDLHTVKLTTAAAGTTEPRYYRLLKRP